ncbi:hypothetical protein HPB48_020139 [Haemaphysalis longicornis]|uniref:Uncharacterized protein n=1 Tax=Haemaphysalis longicornis TaxID=44386 RepID=A0A9J6FHQ3_HAELO|nr:hypothetical protein HPB48_020139 [Haemaphysalis longicornis]
MAADKRQEQENLVYKNFVFSEFRSRPGGFNFQTNLTSLQSMTESRHCENSFFLPLSIVLPARFDGDLNRLACKLISLERILTDAAEGRNFAENNLNELLGAHAGDFGISRLSAQIVLLPTLLRDESPAASERILQILQGKSPGMRKLSDRPGRPAPETRVFCACVSCFRRAIFQCSKATKTFLRNLMTQRRRTHLLLLHVHKKRASELHWDAVMKEFVSRTAERTPIFRAL